MTRRTAGLSLVAGFCLGAALCSGACGSDKKGGGADGGAAGKAAAGAEKGAPKILAEQSAYDFGKVKQGATVEHTFKIRNAGNADLKIEKARGS
jgi:hypothetical protein